MFQTIFKSRENWDFNQGNGTCEQGWAGSRESITSYPLTSVSARTTCSPGQMR